MIFTILGGDKRQLTIAKRLIEGGHKIKLFGLGTLSTSLSSVEHCGNWRRAVESTDILILPLPLTRDGVTVNLSQETQSDPIDIRTLFKSARSCKAILGGLIPVDIIDFAKERSIPLIDYYKDDELQRKNALPSAEGSIMIAMEHTDTIMQGSRALVCGYGKIGAILCDLLYKLGLDVTVAARRDESLCESSLRGYKTARITNGVFEDPDTVKEVDIIFNTVPTVIFTRSVLERMKTKPLYVEIASAPGGIDVSAARSLGLEVIFAPSIPAKYAPITAGNYIYETICHQLDLRGIHI